MAVPLTVNNDKTIIAEAENYDVDSINLYINLPISELELIIENQSNYRAAITIDNVFGWELVLIFPKLCSDPINN
ncbi:hypothetical protein ACN23B_01150 [Anabaena sp. FACHB-709]|uniref:Uncharacterized protein n=2 Tax=Nostocaceae TaxID=1162 RepID=A0A1Z4KQF7_ANAVA|nr:MULTISPECIES: hypothetical protein [Nostocaceae]BAY71200.1 hypothetical protein NIES23_40160 [Trichormus variabilis NIES-23]HBW32757.1 hypothetical protein [Nostoc sp. UBA8866]MBD2171996.1 hypothetical protein [Anabaena cylindrica FACHB-318]MBD2263574.1 hypothetical protein [Anabaena sp. FACHB-709]MBD2273118.1 hypothetical protein [Nostoc sp. PCC 7120 = FACHB-418]